MDGIKDLGFSFSADSMSYSQFVDELLAQLNAWDDEALITRYFVAQLEPLGEVVAKILRWACEKRGLSP